MFLLKIRDKTTGLPKSTAQSGKDVAVDSACSYQNEFDGNTVISVQ
jgi:hypothetical protein